MSKDFTDSPLNQLFELSSGTGELSTMRRYERFVTDGGSVFDLLKMGTQGVVETFGLHSRDAQVLLDRASSLAVHTARAFREQRLVTRTPPNPLHRTGVRAQVETPTLDGLFSLDWENCSPSQSPDSSISPAAYCVRLVLLAWDLEKRAAGGAGLICLADRRPDLTRLIIDSVSMFQIKPTVTLVNEVLESIIKTFIGPEVLKDQVVDDRLLETRFPHRSMPFEWYAEQWKLVLAQNKLSLGEVVRTIDLTAPYFKQPGAHGNLSDIALHQSCNIGPQGQRLLTENFLPASTPSPKLEKFYKDNFGSTGTNLLDSVHFCAQTSIDAQTLTSLLSIEDCLSQRSNNVTESVAPPASPKVFGSVFINEGAAVAMDLSLPGTSATRRLTNATDNRFERMNRMLRLNRWLKLPPDQCDRLVMAAIRAEQRADTVVDSQDPAHTSAAQPFRITHNTLRAIGLFQEFRLRFKCSAEQFAALIDEISPYGRGEEPSQFDRIFNAQALFDKPLMLDDSHFSIEPQTRADKRTVDQICSSLGINQETWRYLARFVAKSYNLTGELQRSLPILSSFYRVVLLASFLRISAIELGTLLEALSERGGSELLQRVLDEPRLRVSGASSVGDVLSVMHAVQSCVQWCQDNALSVSWLVQHVAPVIAPPMATEADITLLQEVHKRLLPVRFSEEALRAAGVPTNNNNEYEGWLELLEEVVDHDGLVLSLTNEADDYERLARGEIQAAVTLAKVPPADVEQACAGILALLLQARDAQNAVIQESLSVYLNLSQDLVLPLLKWVNKGGVYLLLLETTRALEAVTSGTDKINVGDEVLNLLAHLLRRADVVQQLGLSSAMLVALTTRQNWQWLGLKHPETLTLSSLYYLTLFQRMVTHTGQPAEQLLNYLELVNGLPTYLTPEDLRLIRDSAASKLAEVVKWGVREVLECILYLSPSMPVVRDLPTLDTLIRIRGLATSSGLDAKAIIGLGALTPDSDKYACRNAAEQVLGSLSESSVQGQPQTHGELGELGQSVTHDIRCINDTLIANVNNQVALIELTLRDLTNQVLPNITVTWSCDRPGLMETVSITDHEGRAVVRFKPEKGPWMGAVQVKGTYGLSQVVYAPKILIDCEELSLDFSLDSSDDPAPDETFLAGGQAYFPVFVKLVDQHRNPGVGRTVTFAGQGVVADPLVAMTDEEGIARTRVKSIEPVEKANLVASYSTKDSLVINNITFVDKPFIKLLEVASMAVVGQPLVLRCHVISLGKQPSPNISVEFFSEGTSIGSDTTSSEGIAQWTVAAPAAGKQTYTAKVTMGEQRLEVDVASAAMIHGESSDYLYPVADSGTPTLLWVAVRERADNQARLIANCPVWWTVTDATSKKATEPVCYPTDALGRSTYPFEAEKAGDYVVTAVRGTPTGGDERTFDLKVVPPIEWTFKLTDTTTTAVVTQVSAREPLAFIRGRTYTLEIELPPSVDLQDARAMLAWNGEMSAKGLGMIFSPPTGAYVMIGDEKTLSWNIDCKDLRNGTFDLTFYCNRLDQRLVLPGRLDAPPPVLLYPDPTDSNIVEVQPLLIGTGSPSAQIYVFEGREGVLLARTSVRDDGTWSVRFAEPLSMGPHVFSVKQRHIDTTEAWAPDVEVTVTDFVAKVQIVSPAPVPDVFIKVRPESWVEGLGLPGVEVRVVKEPGSTTIYAQGTVGKDGRWRIQFGPALAVGKHTLNAGFYVDGQLKSAWLPAPFYTIEVVEKS
ncbi:Tc toxin subunit A [Pseudomonas sp. H3(2019)]|uniref:Tc toxin subunit A n=1 Tax=Pseudomonas sp. H3(2019) TaxID=2598724 RepID=UPI0011955DE1|nr:Tc toxin subunit A [Pseudomonas sp. H3(2019)]TVT79433.1 virulence plasmid 28 protein [Pseudomonas sp. H3(2019)]